MLKIKTSSEFEIPTSPKGEDIYFIFRVKEKEKT